MRDTTQSQSAVEERKPRKPPKPHRPPPPPYVGEPKAYSVAAFARAHAISAAMFWKLLRSGRAPDTMQVGRRTLISAEAAARWRAQVERDTAAAARKENASA